MEFTCLFWPVSKNELKYNACLHNYTVHNVFKLTYLRNIKPSGSRKYNVIHLLILSL